MKLLKDFAAPVSFGAFDTVGYWLGFNRGWAAGDVGGENGMDGFWAVQGAKLNPATGRLEGVGKVVLNLNGQPIVEDPQANISFAPVDPPGGIVNPRVTLYPADMLIQGVGQSGKAYTVVSTAVDFNYPGGAGVLPLVVLHCEVAVEA